MTNGATGLKLLKNWYLFCPICSQKLMFMYIILLHSTHSLMPESLNLCTQVTQVSRCGAKDKLLITIQTRVSTFSPILVNLEAN